MVLEADRAIVSGWLDKEIDLEEAYQFCKEK